MVKFICIGLLAALAIMAVCVDPPVWPNTFSQKFVSTLNSKNQTLYSVGEHFYDYTQQRSRFDYRDGQYDFFCNTVVNGSTPCSFLVLKGKRYLLFPEKKVGCFCCDSAHGCGVLKPNWLDQATYVGVENLLGQDFYKWDGDMMDYYWATTDAKRVPRKVDQGGVRQLDYLMNSFSTDPIPESVFELPSYVNGDCPETSYCAKLRLQQQ